MPTSFTVSVVKAPEHVSKLLDTVTIHRVAASLQVSLHMRRQEEGLYKGRAAGESIKIDILVHVL